MAALKRKQVPSTSIPQSSANKRPKNGVSSSSVDKGPKSGVSPSSVNKRGSSSSVSVNKRGPKKGGSSSSVSVNKRLKKGGSSSHVSKKPENGGSPSAKVPHVKHARETETDSDPIVESDTTENSGDDNGVSWPSDHASAAQGSSADEGAGVAISQKTSKKGPYVLPRKVRVAQKSGIVSTASKETHARQKALAQERKAAKPNAHLIARSKQLWERLRRKSHVPFEERKKLVAELFDIVTGRVKDFVFKHDSVRVIQTALKYANLDQRKMIARELQGEYRLLAESKYAKFLIGKLLVQGDDEVRDMVLLELFGHVRRMIKHPEASWILDDIYRGSASPTQKARLLCEWYGAEFAIFPTEGLNSTSADLKEILARHPEKRAPIMRSLHELINQLVQKKTTGFTMLHDAMLQYYLNVQPESKEASEFKELLQGDEEHDLLRNLAFTKSGARLVCLALSHGNAKDRKQILKSFKALVPGLLYDSHGRQVLLAAFDVVDDTVLLTKSIVSPLIGKGHPFEALPGNDLSFEEQTQTLLNTVMDRNARIVLLYPFAGKSKAILPADDLTLLDEIHQIRLHTSKKPPEARQNELVASLSPPLLSLIEYNAEALVASSFGCQFVAEVLLSASGDRGPASNAVADVAHDNAPLLQTAFAGRMLKRLMVGGRFNAQTGRVDRVKPSLEFADTLWGKVHNQILVEWAEGANSFVVLAMLEAEGFNAKAELRGLLQRERQRLEQATTKHELQQESGDAQPQTQTQAGHTIYQGTRLLLDLL